LPSELKNSIENFENEKKSRAQDKQPQQSKPHKAKVELLGSATIIGFDDELFIVTTA